MQDLRTLIEASLDSNFCQSLATSLIHTLWQGVLICLVAAILTRLAKSTTAKYWLSFCALICIAICLPANFALHNLPQRNSIAPEGLAQAKPDVESGVASVTLPASLPRSSGGNIRASQSSESSIEQTAFEQTNANSDAEKASRIWGTSDFVSMGYFAGVLLMLTRLLLAIRCGRRTLCLTDELDEPALLNLVQARSQNLGLRFTPCVKVCQATSVPLVVGILKPTILLPVTVTTGLNTEQLSAILSHELAHIKRGDLWANLLQRAIECVLFFHPAAWWLSKQATSYREQACDDAVLSSGIGRIEYVDALLNMAETCLRGSDRAREEQWTQLASAASGSSPSEFRRRILRLLGDGETTRKVRLFPLAIAALVVGVFLSTNTLSLPAQDDAQNESDENEIRQPSWTQWGGSPKRNNSVEAQLPTEWSVASGENVKWVAKLGDSSYFAPVVADGRVFVGSREARAAKDIACLLCFDRESGKLLWRYESPRLDSQNKDMPGFGMASTPAVEDGKVFLLSNRCEVLCLDAESGKAIWKTDLVARLNVNPCRLQTSSPTIVGDYILLGTSHGLDQPSDPSVSDAPSFIALDKHSGKVVWKDASPGANILYGQWSSPAYAVLQGVPQAIFAGGDGWLYSFDFRDIKKGRSNLLWKFDCNPKRSIWNLGGRGTRNNLLATPVIHDGLVYIGVGQNPEHGEGPGHLWCINPNKRGDVSSGLVIEASLDYQLQPGDTIRVIGQLDGAELSQPDKQVGGLVLQIPENGKISLPLLAPMTITGKSVDDADEAIRKAYIAARIIKDDPKSEIHVVVEKIASAGDKVLSRRIQAARPAEQVVPNPNSAAIWHYQGKDQNENGQLEIEETFHRTINSVAIRNGLLVASDISGIVHCLDAKTGKLHWTYDAFAMLYSTPLIAGNRVYVGDEDGEVAIFKLSTSFNLVAELEVEEAISGALISDGEYLYIPSQKNLYVVEEGQESLRRNVANADTKTRGAKTSLAAQEMELTKRILVLAEQLEELKISQSDTQESIQALELKLKLLRAKNNQ